MAKMMFYWIGEKFMWGSLLIFLNSRLAQSVFIIGGIWLTAHLALRKFYQEQKTTRIQKVYFEGGLNKQLKGLEQSLQALDTNAIRFQMFGNLTIAYMKRKKFSVGVLVDTLKQIVNVKELTMFCSYIPKEILIEMFGSSDEVYQLAEWSANCERDISNVIEIMKGQGMRIINEFKSHSEEEIDAVKMTKNVRDVGEYIEQGNQLARRNTLLLRFLVQLTNLYAIRVFKDKNALLAFSKNKEVRAIFSNIDQCYKMLFKFFKKSDEIYYSYVEDNCGKRIKIDFSSEVACFEKYDARDEDQLIVLDLYDDELIRIEMEGSKECLGKIMTDLANEYYFKNNKN